MRTLREGIYIWSNILQPSKLESRISLKQEEAYVIIQQVKTCYHYHQFAATVFSIYKQENLHYISSFFIPGRNKHVYEG